MALNLQGHIHPESSFATISQGEDIASRFPALQAKGKDTRGGVIQIIIKPTKLLGFKKLNQY